MGPASTTMATKSSRGFQLSLAVNYQHLHCPPPTSAFTHINFNVHILGIIEPLFYLAV